jgi:hypothetical protein
MRGAYLDELVELAEEVELGSRPDKRKRRVDSRIVELVVGPVGMEAHGDSLDQVPQLSKDVLREEIPLVPKRCDISTDRLIRASDLLANRGHLVRTSPIAVNPGNPQPAR